MIHFEGLSLWTDHKSRYKNQWIKKIWNYLLIVLHGSFYECLRNCILWFNYPKTESINIFQIALSPQFLYPRSFAPPTNNPILTHASTHHPLSHQLYRGQIRQQLWRHRLLLSGAHLVQCTSSSPSFPSSAPHLPTRPCPCLPTPPTSPPPHLPHSGACLHSDN